MPAQKDQNLKELSPQEILGQLEAFTEEMLQSLTSVNERVRVLAEKLENKQREKTEPAALSVETQAPKEQANETVKQTLQVESVVPGITAAPAQNTIPASPVVGGSQVTQASPSPQVPGGSLGSVNQTPAPQIPVPPSGDEAGATQVFQP